VAFKVISRFFHKASGLYIDPGQDCPLLPAEDAARLVRARCLVKVPDPPKRAAAPQGGRAPSQGGQAPSQGTASPSGPEGAPPQKE